jgi:hypothetical protein
MKRLEINLVFFAASFLLFAACENFSEIIPEEIIVNGKSFKSSDTILRSDIDISTSLEIRFYGNKTECSYSIDAIIYNENSDEIGVIGRFLCDKEKEISIPVIWEDWKAVITNGSITIVIEQSSPKIPWILFDGLFFTEPAVIQRNYEPGDTLLFKLYNPQGLQILWSYQFSDNDTVLEEEELYYVTEFYKLKSLTVKDQTEKIQVQMRGVMLTISNWKQQKRSNHEDRKKQQKSLMWNPCKRMVDSATR